MISAVVVSDGDGADDCAAGLILLDREGVGLKGDEGDE